MDIKRLFPKHLFWDVDMNRLHVDRDKALIIPRALFATTGNSFVYDIIKLESLYSTHDIISVLSSTDERISNEVCELVAKRYKISIFRRFG